MQVVVDTLLANYETSGPKNAKKILILHGWGRSLSDWRNVSQVLSKNYEVILLDLPGHGGSSFPETPMDTFGYSKFVNNFLEKISIKKTILMGHSFGGKVAAVLASQTNIVEKLILIDASGIDKKTLSTEAKVGISNILKVLSPIIPKSILDKVRFKLASEDYKSSGSLKETFKKIVNQDISNEAKKVGAETIIIWGENDKTVTVESAKSFNKLIKNSLVRIVWGAGHHPHLEKPEKFINLLEEYI